MKQLREKIRHAIRLDRAIRFVWQAGAGRVVGSVVLVALQGIIPLAALYLMKLIIDGVSAAVEAPDPLAALRMVWFYIFLAGLVALLQAIVREVSGLVQEDLSLTVSDRMYDILHDKSIAVDLDYYENSEYHDTLHRAQREGPFRPTRIVNNLMGLGQSSISLAAMAGLLLSFHWSVALVLFLAAAPGILVRVKYSRIMFHWQREKTPDERRTMYYSFILTGYAHAKEVRLFGIGEEVSGRFSRLRSQLRGEKLAISRRRALADFIVQFAGTLAVFGTLGFIAYQAVLRMITLGDMVMFFQAFQRGLEYLRQMLRGLADLYENNLFISYFYDFLDFEPQVKNPAEPLFIPAPAREGVAFDGVWFGYPGTGKNVLKGVSFTIAPGEVVALVGGNGSGKTTLAKLLCRLYDPDRGQITMEHISLDRFDVAALRKTISVIFQDFARYHLTVEDNIGFGNISRAVPGTEAVRKAAREAGVDTVIESLPHQYQTVLGKMFAEGVELSIGQWQMIALARAFIRDSRLIVLDEPTSSLDAGTEYAVFGQFRNLMDKNSALLISHRFSTVRMADRILVLKDGRLVEQGSHGMLMEKNGYYADLFTKQASQYGGR